MIMTTPLTAPPLCPREPVYDIVIDPLILINQTCRAELLSLRAGLPTQTAVSDNTDRITITKSLLLLYTSLSLNILSNSSCFISSFSLNNYLTVPSTLIEYSEDLVLTSICSPSYGSWCTTTVQSISFLMKTKSVSTLNFN